MDEKQPEAKPPVTAHVQRSRETQLIEAGERAAMRDQRQASHPDRGKEYLYQETLGETTPTEICKLLFDLKESNQVQNHIHATIDAFTKAKRITVSLQTNSVYGQPPALNRLVIEIDDRERISTAPDKA
jgi:hypothetical protein